MVVLIICSHFGPCLLRAKKLWDPTLFWLIRAKLLVLGLVLLSCLFMARCLHVPKLCSPLLSVRCLHHYDGCNFLVDNQGSFLTFPQFVLPVDDSSDCTISGSIHTSYMIHFDSRIAGSIAAVSDNTRFCNQRRPTTLTRSSINKTVSIPSSVPTSGDSPITTDDPIIQPPNHFRG